MYNDTMATLQAAMTEALENHRFRKLALFATTAARLEEAEAKASIFRAERAALEAIGEEFPEAE